MTLAKLLAVDNSQYTIAPPRIRGLFPRMARQLSADSAAVLFSSSAGKGSLMSGELAGVLAQGFIGEMGNFIQRSFAQGSEA